MNELQILQSIAVAWMIANVISLILYLLQAWGLYLINKKLWEDYPWLAYIPLVQVYSFVKASWKWPIWILWLIIWTILFILPGLIIAIYLMHLISKRCGRWAWTTVWFVFVPFIMYPIVGTSLKENISQNNINTYSNEQFTADTEL